MRMITKIINTKPHPVFMYLITSSDASRGQKSADEMRRVPLAFVLLIAQRLHHVSKTGRVHSTHHIHKVTRSVGTTIFSWKRQIDARIDAFKQSSLIIFEVCAKL